MKNIGLFINSMHFGGAERVVSRLCKILSEDYKVYVLLVDDTDMKYEINVPVINLGGNYKNYKKRVLHTVYYLNREIRKKNIECVISFLDVPNLLNCLWNHSCKKVVSYRAFCRPIREVWHIHPAQSLKMLLSKFAYRKANMIVGVSKRQAKAIREVFNIPFKKISVIENMYDFDEIQNLCKKDIDVTEQIFIETHETAITVGRLCEEKGQSNLLYVFEKVLKKCPSAGLIIIGNGPLKEKLKQLCYLLNLENNILWISETQNPFAYMKKSKLYVGMSLTEGFPNTLVEAMICGIPVMHTDCLSGPGEILREKYIEKQTLKVDYADYGVLLPDYIELDDDEKERTAQEIARNWVKMLADQTLNKKYAMLAQQRAGEFTYERCLKKYRAVIENI